MKKHHAQDKAQRLIELVTMHARTFGTLRCSSNHTLRRANLRC